MGILDRFLRRLSGQSAQRSHDASSAPVRVPAQVPDGRPVAAGASSAPGADEAGVDTVAEAQLWARLKADPNDIQAFGELAEMVRLRATLGHAGGDPQRAADDAVWSLAEELAHSGRAWFPLVELARLSVHDDREAGLRRLGTAAERDPSGVALATGLGMLREERMPSEAVNLAVGHWRPREHDLAAGRQVVEASIEAGRVGDARRHLTALLTHPDTAAAEEIRAELAPLIDRAEAQLPPRTPAGGIPLIDLRELRAASSRNPFRRH
jgi:hypothetical protein